MKLYRNYKEGPNSYTKDWIPILFLSTEKIMEKCVYWICLIKNTSNNKFPITWWLTDDRHFRPLLMTWWPSLSYDEVVVVQGCPSPSNYSTTNQHISLLVVSCWVERIKKGEAGILLFYKVLGLDRTQDKQFIPGCPSLIINNPHFPLQMSTAEP